MVRVVFFWREVELAVVTGEGVWWPWAVGSVIRVYTWFDLLSRAKSFALFDTCSSLIPPDLRLSGLLPKDFAKPLVALRSFDCANYPKRPVAKSGGKQSS